MSKKRKERGPRGSGSVYQRGDGLWVASVSVGCDTEGKQKRKYFYAATQAAVLDKKKELEGRLGRGDEPLLQKAGAIPLTLRGYLSDLWLPGIKDSIEPNTYKPYHYHCTNYILPDLGEVPLDKILPLGVQQFYQRLKEKKRVGVAAAEIATTLTTALAYAVLPLQLIPINPAKGVKKPKVAKAEVKPLTPAQVSAFLGEAQKDRLHPYYVTALDSGAGPGECFGLEWRDLDFGTGILAVRRSLEDDAGHLRPKDTKRRTRRRTIKLSPHTLAILESHRQREQAEGRGRDTDPIFTDTKGGRLRNTNLTRRSYQPILARAQLEGFRLYDLRHTCATLLLLAGVPAKVVSERLGHAGVTITLDTYSHVLPTMQEGAATALDAVLRRVYSPELRARAQRTPEEEAFIEMIQEQTDYMFTQEELEALLEAEKEEAPLEAPGGADVDVGTSVPQVPDIWRDYLPEGQPNEPLHPSRWADFDWEGWARGEPGREQIVAEVIQPGLSRGAHRDPSLWAIRDWGWWALSCPRRVEFLDQVVFPLLGLSRPDGVSVPPEDGGEDCPF